MSRDDRKSGARTGRRKLEARVLPASPELTAAQEAELWGTLERRKIALESLAQAKLISVDSCMRSVDWAPLSRPELAKLTEKAIRRAIEQPAVVQGLGAILPARAHDALCGCVAEALEKRDPPAALTSSDPAEWVKARIPLDHFEGALRAASSDEENLWHAIQDGCHALDRLMRRFTPLALHLSAARRGLGLSLPERRAAALEGLRKAILGFRLELGNRFSTYATRIIRNEVAEAFRGAPGLYHAPVGRRRQRAGQAGDGVRAGGI